MIHVLHDPNDRLKNHWQKPQPQVSSDEHAAFLATLNREQALMLLRNVGTAEDAARLRAELHRRYLGER